MTRIFCTKKLHGLIGSVETTLESDNIIRSLSDWNSHLFFVDKRKCLIFVNNLTYYTIFITDILKKDLINIDKVFSSRLKEQLIHDKIINDSESIESLFPVSKIQIYKTNNDRKTIGRINDFINMFKAHCFYKYEHLKNMDIVYENGLINKTPTGKPNEIKKSWSNPIDNINEIKKPAHNKV